MKLSKTKIIKEKKIKKKIKKKFSMISSKTNFIKILIKKKKKIFNEIVKDKFHKKIKKNKFFNEIVKDKFY
jgi:hypothetical protein